MNVSVFNGLSTCDKFTLMNRKAIYLEADRLSGKYKVSLFYMQGFYVELWLNQQTDQLEKAEGFASYRKLDPYLSGIDLTPVYVLL